MGASVRGTALLGGSFNPPHIGHLRVALEVAEQCEDTIARVVLLPCAHPPHKAEKGLLPFDLRCALLEAACAPCPCLSVSRLEGERETRSYTWDTLTCLRARAPKERLSFLLGSDDYVQLATWYRGVDLPLLTDLLVVPRTSFSLADFARATRTLWPQACLAQDTAVLPGGGTARFLPIPVLAVSATDIRRRFLEGRSIDFLVPRAVARILAEHRAEVARIWEGA